MDKYTNEILKKEKHIKSLKDQLFYYTSAYIENSEKIGEYRSDIRKYDFYISNSNKKCDEEITKLEDESKRAAKWRTIFSRSSLVLAALTLVMISLRVPAFIPIASAVLLVSSAIGIVSSVILKSRLNKDINNVKFEHDEDLRKHFDKENQTYNTNKKELQNKEKLSLEIEKQKELYYERIFTLETQIAMLKLAKQRKFEKLLKEYNPNLVVEDNLQLVKKANI